VSNLKTYNIFISHAWKYSDDYNRLVKLLDESLWFLWRNYSDPSHDPIIDPNTNLGKEKLKKELDEQIRPVNCVIVISGMYVAYRYWIQTEIDIAISYGKPIIGVKPWGQQRIPKEVQDVAVEMVGWNAESIISAIRRHSI